MLCFPFFVALEAFARVTMMRAGTNSIFCPIGDPFLTLSIGRREQI